MDKEFYKEIHRRQKSVDAVPSNESIAQWTTNLICLLFPEKSECKVGGIADIEREFKKLEEDLVDLFNQTRACENADHTGKAARFFEGIPLLYRSLNQDIEAIVTGDPAARTTFEVIRAYPGFLAISFYRVAHALLDLDIPVIPRIITEYAHSKTGIDIHPAAEIGEHFFIDHGTGIVIGETTIIGDHVKLYQGVTLGALSVTKDMSMTKRHPTVEDYVIIYSGATILGGETTIGHHSVIGGNVWLTKSIPPYSTVYHRPDIEVVEQMNI